MRTRMLAVLCVAGLLPLFSGCMPFLNIVTANADDNGQTVHAAVGGWLIVNLASNPSTGFDWTITQIDTAVLEQIGESVFISNPSAPGEVGVGGTRTWIFAVQAAGPTTLTLEYRRAGQPQSEPAAQTFTITVDAT
jgi:inhibitor of cysteine peptidase